MAGINEVFKSAYDTIHIEVTELNKSSSVKDWGTAFEKWCVPKLSQWFQIPEADTFWVGEKGDERMLDIGMIDRTHDIIYIVQCKSTENEDYNKATTQNYKMVAEADLALKWLKDVPDDGKAERKKFAREVCEFLGCNLDELKNQSDDKFRRLFVTNSVVTQNKQVESMVKNGLEIWDIEKLYNNCFSKKRELSNEIDVYHLSEAKEGENITIRFGYVKAIDLVNFSRINRSSNQIDDTLFEDNLRHQLHTKEAKAIRNDIIKSLLENPKDFASLNNGLLIVGARTSKYSQGFKPNPHGTLAWEGSDKPSKYVKLSNNKSKSPEEEKELKILEDEMNTISKEITSILISQPGILNGGQTTTALYDHIVKHLIPHDENGKDLSVPQDELKAAKDALVFCKFCFIQEGDETSRQKLAIASNRQNPIEAIDYLSYRPEHKRIFEAMDSLPHSILYLFKRGLGNRADEEESWKTRVSSNLDARYMRKIAIDKFGLNLLATREGKPGKAREGADAAKILVVGSDNYEAVFGKPSKFDMKVVIFGEFLRRITELQKRTRNQLVGEQKKKDIAAVANIADEDDKNKERQKQSNTIARNIIFTNYWTYTLMYLFYKIFTEIASNYFPKREDTIFENCKNEEECVELLYNLAIHGENSDFLESTDAVSLCFHKNASKTHFSDVTRPDSTDPKNKIKVHFEKGDILTLLTGQSDTHPILFKTIHTIYDSLQSKYDPATGGAYFNDERTIDKIWGPLQTKCNGDDAILNTFGIQVSTKTPAIAVAASGASVKPYDELKKLCEQLEGDDSFEEFVAELVDEEHHKLIDISKLTSIKIKNLRKILLKQKVQNVPDKDNFLSSLLEEIDKLIKPQSAPAPESKSDPIVKKKEE